ncbi:MAG TPA: hypothetical protein VIL48_21440 [Acidimicrobiales bacterium]
MSNEQLRQALASAQLTHEDVAAELGVDPKTVQRWVTLGRTPHRRHRRRLAELLDRTEPELWPGGDQTGGPSDLIRLYPERAAVPRAKWLGLLTSATEHVDVLAWAATFFHQVQPRVAELLGDAARRGARVRLCFGDPGSQAVATREHEEPLLGEGALAAKIRVSLRYVRDALDVEASRSASTAPSSTPACSAMTTR